VNPQVWHLDRLACITANCYAAMLELEGADAEARRVLEQTLADHPDSLRLRRHLLELHVKHARRDEALAEFDRLPADTPKREALRSAVRGACLAAQRNWIAARAYLDAAWQAGCRDLICLRWLVATLLAQGETEAARPIVAAWRGIDPTGEEADKYLEAIIAPAQPRLASEQRKVRIDRAPSSPAAATLPNAIRQAKLGTGDAK
jgi:hypothetical protein